MHLQIPHKMPSKDRAVAKIKTALAQNKAQIAEHAAINEERWEGDTLHFAVDLQGKTITGTLGITDTEYVLDATLPLLWRMFEGQIESEVKKQVEGMV